MAFRWSLEISSPGDGSLNHTQKYAYNIFIFTSSLNFENSFFLGYSFVFLVEKRPMLIPNSATRPSAKCLKFLPTLRQEFHQDQVTKTGLDVHKVDLSPGASPLDTGS